MDDIQLKLKFAKLVNRNDVANILEIDDKSLRYFLYGIKVKNMYTDFFIPKKSGGKRRIHAPNKILKNIQRKLAHILNLIYEPKICTCGFVLNKNIVSNAEKHIKRKLIINVDLENFFTQINFGRVRGALMSKPYSVGEQAATVISQIVCFEGYLPQGAPTSPIISNIVCRSMDNSFMRLAKKYNITYSRYADDLTFSTFSNKFPNEIAYIDNNKIKLGNDILNVLKDNSFKYNDKKIFIRNRNQHQEVTGLTVNQKVNISRTYLKNLRAILYNISKSSIYDVATIYIEKGFCKNKNIVNIYKTNDSDKVKVIEEWFKSVIIGKIYFIRQVKGKYDRVFIKFAKDANRAFNENIFDLSYVNNFMDIVTNSVFVIESNISQGSCFYTDKLGLVTCFHVVEDNGFYNVYKHFDHNSNIEFLTTEQNQIYCDKNIDYAIFQVDDTKYHKYFKIADGAGINVGDKVTVIGYPDYLPGDSPYIENCEVTSKTKSFGAMLYTVSGRLVHGSSGGCVINENNEIIGIIKSGVATSESEKDNGKHGFVPISMVLKNIEDKQKRN